MVNSLHGQAIDRLAPGMVVEAVAEDGTIEAVRRRDRARLRRRRAVAPGMGLGRQPGQPGALPRVRRGVPGLAAAGLNRKAA